MSGGEPSSIKRIAVCAVRVPDLSRLLLHRAYRIIQGKVCSLAKDRFLFSQKRRDGFCTKLCTGNTGRKPLTMWWGSRSSPKRSRPRCVPDGLATPIFLSAPAARAKRPARAFSPRRSTASTRWTETPATSATPAAALRTAPFSTWSSWTRRPTTAWTMCACCATRRSSLRPRYASACTSSTRCTCSPNRRSTRC